MHKCESRLRCLSLWAQVWAQVLKSPLWLNRCTFAPTCAHLCHSCPKLVTLYRCQSCPTDHNKWSSAPILCTTSSNLYVLAMPTSEHKTRLKRCTPSDANSSIILVIVLYSDDHMNPIIVFKLFYWMLASKSAMITLSTVANHFYPNL